MTVVRLLKACEHSKGCYIYCHILSAWCHVAPSSNRARLGRSQWYKDVQHLPWQPGEYSCHWLQVEVKPKAFMSHILGRAQCWTVCRYAQARDVALTCNALC